MPLQVTNYANGIESLLDSLFNTSANVTPAQARANFATAFANLTKTFVQTGEVAAGIPVATTGNASNHNGATTQKGTII